MIQNYKQAIENIRGELKNYIQNAGLKSLVIGVSGGIDSALCIFLARPVCKELGIDLLGISLPSSTNKEDETKRAKDIGRCCNKFAELSIDSYCREFFVNMRECSGPEDTKLKIQMGNVKARVRMILLYDAAQIEKGMVLSTDNYTEYLLGFWTLHGDVGDYGMIQSLWKTEVYKMAQWIIDNELDDAVEKLRLKKCIDAVPTDGLGITNSDLDQIGVDSYEEVDKILKNRNIPISSEMDESDKKVIMRLRNTEFKRNNPHNISRDIIEA